MADGDQQVGTGAPRTCVGDLSDFPDATMRTARLGGRPVVLARVGDRIACFPDRCLHAHVRLSEGRLEGDVLTCRWHQWRYRLTTGEVLTEESPYSSFTTFPVSVEDGRVWVSHLPATRPQLRPEPG